MTFKLLFSYVLCFPLHANGLSVEIEGLIDLGPKWNYEYKFSPVYHEGKTVKIQNMLKLFNTSKIDSEFKNERRQKLRITKEKKASKIKLADTLENQTDKHTYSEEQYVKTSKGKENIETFNSMDQTAKSKSHHSDETSHRSTKFTFYVQLNNEKKLKPKKNLRNHETIGPFAETAGVLPSKNKLVHKNHKNVKSSRFHENMRNGVHKVKDDPNIFDFTLHIFKQNLKNFDNIIRKTQLDRIKREIKSLKKTYSEEFKSYLRQNKYYNIRTMLGHEKVILNTIDTSNNILQRLVNRLSDTDNDESFQKTVKKLKRKCDRQKLTEEQHACKKFGVCRSNEDFSEFLKEVIEIILRADSSKVKQAADAFTEVVKTTDLTTVFDDDLQINLRKHINDVELSDPRLIRTMLLVLSGAISDKNHPIVIMNDGDILTANKSIAFHNLLDILNKNVTVAENSAKWDEIKIKLGDWKDGAPVDILNIFETIMEQLKTALDNMDFKTTQQVQENMKILLNKPLKQ